MKFILFVFLVSLNVLLSANSDYEFVGKHLILSYLDCDELALNDEDLLKDKMIEAARASGVTVLSSSHHHFDPSGMTQVLLLSESHASIHTYPEFKACFVDLFTCGLSFEMDQFEKIMSEYLKPAQTVSKLLLRNEDHQEMAFLPHEPQAANLLP